MFFCVGCASNESVSQTDESVVSSDSDASGIESDGESIESEVESSLTSAEESSAIDSSSMSEDESADSESSESSESSENSENSEYSEMVSEEEKIITNIPDPLVVGYEKYENPYTQYAADPFFAYRDGKYYHCFLAWGCFFVSSFDTLEEATTDGAVVAYIPSAEDAEYMTDCWAPEMHYIDGYWYIYYSASDGKSENHRMYVLKSKTPNAMGEYEFVGQITDSTNKWAIDGTVFEYKGEMYYCWSGWHGDHNVAQYLYIAKMSSPTTLSSERVCISTPTREWEIQGGSPMVNEGPAVIVDGDYLTILYSASGSWCDDYCLGQLLFTGGDVLKSKNWKKISEPVLQKQPEKFYGPGHCSVVPDEKGVLWIVFHANLESGTGWNGRSGWMYPIRINDKGIIEVILY
jgi:GH43 family beta-xylosidase